MNNPTSWEDFKQLVWAKNREERGIPETEEEKDIRLAGILKRFSEREEEDY